MKLQKIGYLGGNITGWETLFAQIGIFCEPAEIPGENLSQYRVVAAGDIHSDEAVGILKRYLNCGGSALMSGLTFHRIGGPDAKLLPVKFLFHPDDPFFPDAGLVDLYTRCSMPLQANAGKTERSRSAVFVGEYAGGNVVVLPFDPSGIVLDGRISTKSFYARRKHRLPFERVSLVNKNGIRAMVARALEILCRRAGFPHHTLWHFPNTARSLFSFRIDTDYASQQEVERLHRFLREKNVGATWFVDAGSQKNFLSVFREMTPGQEIALHCFHHKSFPDFERNRANIEQGLNEMQRAGLSVRGFAAPYGAWNDGIARAIKEHAFEFSSEFSYDYDNLPSYPVLNEARIDTLQVPVHPVSIGSLRRQGFSEEEMMDYFDDLLRRNFALEEPIFLYHHPKDGHENVLDHIFRKIREMNVPVTKMGEFASWWKRRGEIMKDADGMEQCADSSMALKTIEADGQQTFFSVSSSGKTARQKDAAGDYRFPSDLPRMRKFNPWIPIIRCEDWIMKLLRKTR